MSSNNTSLLRILSFWKAKKIFFYPSQFKILLLLECSIHEIGKKKLKKHRAQCPFWSVDGLCIVVLAPYSPAYEDNVIEVFLQMPNISIAVTTHTQKHYLMCFHRS